MSLLIRTLTADRGDVGQRLDLVLRRHLTDVSAATRTRVQAWIESGRVAVNGTPVFRVSSRVAQGQTITVALPDTAARVQMTAEDARLDVLHEDAHLLAINKPAGMVVHPTYRNTSGTAMNALLWHAREWPAPQRPSLVGRLDKLTSGIVLIAKTAEVHARLQRELASTSARKEYLALVYGAVRRPRGTIDWRLGRDPKDRRRVVASRTNGVPSLTEFERLAPAGAPRSELTLLRCRLVTGRTHQIRVHLAAEGWPIVGDPTYGTQPDNSAPWTRIPDASLAAAVMSLRRQALHAWRLTFAHPSTGAPVTIEAPVPADLGHLFDAAGLSYS